MCCVHIFILELNHPGNDIWSYHIQKQQMIKIEQRLPPLKTNIGDFCSDLMSQNWSIIDMYHHTQSFHMGTLIILFLPIFLVLCPISFDRSGNQWRSVNLPALHCHIGTGEISSLLYWAASSFWLVTRRRWLLYYVDHILSVKLINLILIPIYASH